MDIAGKFSSLLFIVLVLSLSESNGQQVPLNPISYRIFSPVIFNPAIAGSKDFLSVDLIGSTQRYANSQVISISGRLAKKGPGYVSSNMSQEFTNIGIGGNFFHEMSGSYRNIGAGITASYHLPLDKQRLSYLSFGTSVRGIYNIYSGDPDLSIPSDNTMFPNVDLGLYYYGPAFYAGLSATNILGSPREPDSLGIGGLPVSRQYFAHTGVKILISRALNIVIEPSVIINTDGSSSMEIKDILEPMLKIYMENMCLGTYFNDFNKYSIFFQYKYPKFYLGTFFQLPRNSPYFKSDLVAEFTFGLNLSRFALHNHW